MEKVIKFLKKEFPEGIQMFNTRNIVGDVMTEIYYDIEDDIKIDYCIDYQYIEIFGLTDEEFEKVREECEY